MTEIQKLERLEAVCFQCHMIIHYGYASGQNYIDKKELKQHFCSVNDTTLKEFDLHLIEAATAWRKRNEVAWNVDFGVYERFVTIEIPRKGRSKDVDEIIKGSLFPYIEGMETLFAGYYISAISRGLKEGKGFDGVYDIVLQQIFHRFPPDVLSNMKYKSLNEFKSKERNKVDIDMLVKSYHEHASKK